MNTSTRQHTSTKAPRPLTREPESARLCLRVLLLSCSQVNTPTLSRLVPRTPLEMFTALATNLRNRPLTCDRPGHKSRRSWTAPLSQVHTSTRKPVNFVRSELANIPTTPPVNRFGQQHLNSAARCQHSLSSPQRVNSFAGGTSRLVGKSPRKRVYRQTRKPLSAQTCEPAVRITHPHEQEVNMSSHFTCKRDNTLTTSMVNS